MKLKRVFTAAVILAAVFTLNTAHPEARDSASIIRLGNGFYVSNRLDEAESAFREACVLEPANPWARNNLGLTLIREGKYAEAQSNFRTAIENKPDYAKAWNNLGLAQMQSGDPVSAEDSFRRSLIIDPTLAEPAYNLAFILPRNGKTNESISNYAIFLQKFTNHFEAHREFGRLALRLSMTNESLAALRKAVSLSPEDPETLGLFGECLLRSGETRAAADTLAQAISKAKTNTEKTDLARLHALRAESLEAAKSFDAAIAAWLRAAELDPNKPAYASAAGLLLFQSGGWKEALSAFRTASQAEPENPSHYLNIARCLLALDAPAEALKELEKPAAKTDTTGILHILRGNALYRLTRYREAVEAYTRALATFAEDPDLYYLRGAAKRKAGLSTTANADFRRATELGNPEAKELRGR